MGLDPTNNALYPYDLRNARPLDLKSAFKAGANAALPYQTIDSVGIPYLTLEQLQYRFGVRDQARQTATLRGDSLYYNPGSTYIEKVAGSGAAGQTYATANPAYPVTEGGITRRTLNVMAGTKRLFYGVDYTETYGAVTNGAAITTITVTAAVATTDNIQVMYASPTLESFPQTVHEGVSVKPAAVRGRDIAVYLGGYSSGSPYANRLLGVQAATIDWRVSLVKDEEFGNYRYVAQDYDVPQVTGTIQVKPVDVPTLLALMQKVAGTATALESATATTAPVIPLDIIIKDPVTGNVVKHLYVDDARFTIPGFSGRVQNKFDISIPFRSDQGDLAISKT